MTYPETNILSLIPQAPPFVMVDRLLYSDEITTRTAFRIPPENVFVENGFFSAAGLMENIAQTVAAGAGFAARLANRAPGAGYIASVKNLEITALPGINDELITEIRIGHRVLDIVVISGRISCNGKAIAQCEMKILISQLK
jgi:predicted hotdog family 3-hydroxylacyl-ACP dehydratase